MLFGRLDAGGRVGGGIEFNTDLFSEDMLQVLASRTHSGASFFCSWTCAEKHLLTRYLPSAELDQVLSSFNDSIAAFSHKAYIHSLVAHSCCPPEAQVLEWQRNAMPHADMMRCASHGQLRKSGVTHNTVAALQLHRSLEQALSMLATLISGGAYLPLDLNWPVNRRKDIIYDACCCALIAQAIFITRMKTWFDGAMLVYENALCSSSFRSEQNGPSQSLRPKFNICSTVELPTPQTLAYAIFTSGSTGLPKGALLAHTGGQSPFVSDAATGQGLGLWIGSLGALSKLHFLTITSSRSSRRLCPQDTRRVFFCPTPSH